MAISELRWLRRLVLPALKRFGPGDMTIAHHYTKEPLRLHGFRHKGYWYYGKKRERETMAGFARLIRPGDTVVEVGGHIGYMSLYFARLAGHTGCVHVFEPGPNNWPYIAGNVAGKRNIVLDRRGVGSACGALTLYLDDLTGQNNSFVPHFEGFAANCRNAYVGQPPVEEARVEVVTLDAYAEAAGVRPDFIKIDVEGFELEVARGMTGLLERDKPALMIEVQRDREKLWELLAARGYRAFRADFSPVRTPEELELNTFFLHPESRQAQALIW
ncbi:FkbM family methyltransferase [Paenibacillus athensensis]|uniref:Methyltransferase FkbM domain-containing protein n=1 Tax=Paenibacillus athensensis TaxID=1967502 RepID=A0A4Y8PRM6_9BACL|nr:FkbM family methyltransferase [Paenibacillus athensensis]MCD1260481.1 FkbM family methyltransferase [Paenibacillus athensensis]